MRRKMREIAALPSGHVGVYRADDGKRWEAYVMERDLVLLGVYATRRAAVAARAKYWRAKGSGREIPLDIRARSA
jgi:hypothetical protein